MKICGGNSMEITFACSNGKGGKKFYPGVPKKQVHRFVCIILHRRLKQFCWQQSAEYDMSTSL